jgi:hypothetical protein
VTGIDAQEPASTADAARFYANLHAALAHRLAYGPKLEHFAEFEKQAPKLATSRRFSASVYERFEHRAIPRPVSPNSRFAPTARESRRTATHRSAIPSSRDPGSSPTR